MPHGGVGTGRVLPEGVFRRWLRNSTLLLLIVGLLLLLVCLARGANTCWAAFIGYMVAALLCFITKVRALALLAAPAGSQPPRVGINHLHVKNDSKSKWLKRLEAKRRMAINGPIVDPPPPPFPIVVPVGPNSEQHYADVWLDGPEKVLTVCVPIYPDSNPQHQTPQCTVETGQGEFKKPNAGLIWMDVVLEDYHDDDTGKDGFKVTVKAESKDAQGQSTNEKIELEGTWLPD